MLTPRAERALLAAGSIAREVGMTWVGTEHMLLALIGDPRGIARQILEDSHTPDEAGAAIERLFKDPQYLRTSRRYRRRTNSP
jgi:ATP-dependent Clp protease ATP-binding subunit ClpA